MTLRRVSNDTLIDWEKLDNLPLNTNNALSLKADNTYVDNENNILQWQIKTKKLLSSKRFWWIKI